MLPWASRSLNRTGANPIRAFLLPCESSEVTAQPDFVAPNIRINSGVSVCSSGARIGQISGMPSELKSIAWPVVPMDTSAIE